jgi:hypothetical protein
MHFLVTWPNEAPSAASARFYQVLIRPFGKLGLSITGTTGFFCIKNMRAELLKIPMAMMA